MRIRRFRLGDEPALFQVFHSAVHLIAARDYTPEQIEAWAPADLDQELWRERMWGIRPFIAEIDGSPSAGGLLEQFQAGGQTDHGGRVGLARAHASTSTSTSMSTSMSMSAPTSVREPIIVGYADVQESGYIDHFFVSGHHPRQGIGNALMARLHEEAARLELPELTSDVSRSAQPFFAHHGFDIVEQRHPVRRGVVIPNALMRKRLTPLKT